MKQLEKLRNVLKEELKKIGKDDYFEDIAKEWLESKKKKIKKSTYFNYEYKIYKYLMPTFYKCKVKKLKRFNYEEFVEMLQEKYENKTIRDILNVLKAILKYANNKYNCQIKYENIELPKLENKKLKILTKREKNKIEKHCLKEKSLRSIGILICLNTGIRIGELCALKWKNIDFSEKTIYISHTLQRVYSQKNKKSKVIIDKPKTDSSIRTIPMSNKLYEILKVMKKEYDPESFLLTGKEYKYIEPRTFQNSYKEILQMLKIKPYKFHILRHTFATECVEVGMDIKSLSEILGHSDINITLNRYVHSSYKMKKKYLEKL